MAGVPPDDGSATERADREPPGWSARHTLLAVACVAVPLRLLSLFSTPLVFTTDSIEYVIDALDFVENGFFHVKELRTPAYPLLLSGCLALFGPSPVGILLVQHALGVVTVLLVAFTSCRLAGPWIGLGVGLLCALDPWLLVFESHAMSEATTATAVTLAAAITLGARRLRATTAIALGAALGVACLFRPAIQVLVPFFAIGWLANARPGGRQAVQLGAILLLSLVVTLAPWLIHNHSRGVSGLARGGSLQVWGGLARAGLVEEPRFPVDPEIVELFRQRIEPGEVNRLHWAFLWETQAVETAELGPVFDRWVEETIRRDPGAYLRLAAYNFLWQITVYPESGFLRGSELPWYMMRLSEDGRDAGHPLSNFNSGGDLSRLARFEMPPLRSGLLAGLYAWWIDHYRPGFPQVPLLLVAALAATAALFRGQWAVLAVVTGSIAFIAAHALLLLSHPRFTLPIWPIWYASFAYAIGIALAWLRGFRQRGGSG